MKSIFAALFVILFVSCSSDDDNNEILKDYTEENELEILAFVAQHDLDATRTESGLYVIINELGEGNNITSSSDVAVRYRAMLTDGNVFDDKTVNGIAVNLENVIDGWKEGFQYFYEGGSGVLIIPAHLGFGSDEYEGVPAGSVLVIEFELVDYETENEDEIVAYIEENSLNAEATGSGLYYVINEEGSGQQPFDTSYVTVAYKGYLTNGEVFDESSVDGVGFYLDEVIEGWTEGMQLFKAGGNGTLLIPSHLGYGIYGNVAIPGGAVLIFDVNLKSVQ